MIDKRISYRGGGSYRGGSSGSSRSSSSGPGPGGQGARGQATQNPGGGGGGGPDPREQAAQRSREQAAKRATEEKKQREAALKAKKDIEAKQAAKDKAAKEKKQREEQEKRSKEKGKSLHGGPTVKEALAPIKKKKQEEQEKISKEKGEALHGGPTVKEAVAKGKKTKEIRDLIAQQEEEKYDVGRRYTPDFDLLEKLGVTRPEGILGSLVDTGEKYLDPKKMLKDAAIKYGMKKMGLGAINPYLGVASLLKDTNLNPLNWFKRKPVDMTAFNKLGFYDKGTPAAADTLTAKARDAYNLPLEENVIAENIARFTGGKSGISPELQALMAKGKSYGETDIMPSGIDSSLATQAGVADAQKTIIGGQLPGLKEGLFPVQNVYDKAKKFDDKGIFGIGSDEMTKQEFNEYIKSQGYTGPGLELANGGVVGLYKYGGYLG